MSTGSHAAITRTPTIIGIYGVSGSGKSYLSGRLKSQLGETTFAFYEGSEQLLKTSGNTLENFKRLPAHEQSLIRTGAIKGVSRECTETGKAGIVTGHFLLGIAHTGIPDADLQIVMMEADKKAYTHILYLKPTPETIVEQVAKDSSRERPQLSVATIRQGQEYEEKHLRSICRDNSILFMTFLPNTLDETAAWIQDAVEQNEMKPRMAGDQHWQRHGRVREAHPREPQRAGAYRDGGGCRTGRGHRSRRSV